MDDASLMITGESKGEMREHFDYLMEKINLILTILRRMEKKLDRDLEQDEEYLKTLKRL